jgi:hypothetical protein
MLPPPASRIAGTVAVVTEGAREFFAGKAEQAFGVVDQCVDAPKHIERCARHVLS